MNKKWKWSLFAFVMGMTLFMPHFVTPVKAETELENVETTQLAAPELSWSTNGIFSLKWEKVSSATTVMYEYELYKDDVLIDFNYTLISRSVKIGPTIESNGAGTYTARVRAYDTVSYAESEWSTIEYVYTVPETKLPAPNVYWDFDNEDRIYDIIEVAWNEIDGVSGYQYLTELYCDGELIRSSDVGYYKGNESEPYTSAFYKHGLYEKSGTYEVKVYALSSDPNTIVSSDAGSSGIYNLELPSKTLSAPTNICWNVDESGNDIRLNWEPPTDDFYDFVCKVLLYKDGYYVTSYAGGYDGTGNMSSIISKNGYGIYTVKVRSLTACPQMASYSEYVTGPEFVYDAIIPNDETGIPDKNFYDALLSCYDSNGDGVLTGIEAASTGPYGNNVYFNFRDKGIESIKGIEYFSIRTLDLRNNDITDLTPLLRHKNVDDIEEIKISNNNITDISALSRMSNLTRVYASNNQIEDISALSGKEWLRFIYLDGNKIKDVSPLAELTPYIVDISDNQVTDISSWKNSALVNALGEYASADSSDWASADTLPAYYNPKGTLSLNINIANGNCIPYEQAKEILPQSLMQYKLLKYNEDSGDYDILTDTTWESTQDFYIEETEVIDPVEAFVRRMYTEALGREYDEAGCTFWTNSLKDGTRDGVTVARQFLTSKELVAQNLSNEEFISRLYATFFDREEPTTSTGFKFWMNYLENGVSRKFVIRGFAHSAEFTAVCNNYGITRGNMVLTDNSDQNANVTMYVFRCYDRVLGRTPDASGLNYWTGEINKKTKNPIKVAEQVVFSKEFLAKNVDNETYIRILYNMFFDREADANGLKFWLEEMNSGRRDRYKVLTQFANSAEFKAVLKTFGW